MCVADWGRFFCKGRSIEWSKVAQSTPLWFQVVKSRTIYTTIAPHTPKGVHFLPKLSSIFNKNLLKFNFHNKNVSTCSVIISPVDTIFHILLPLSSSFDNSGQCHVVCCYGICNMYA